MVLIFYCGQTIDSVSHYGYRDMDSHCDIGDGLELMLLLLFMVINPLLTTH